MDNKFSVENIMGIVCFWAQKGYNPLMEIITVERESYAQRSEAVVEADRTRAIIARMFGESPTEENCRLHQAAYQQQVDLMNRPLATRFKVLGIRIPLVGRLLSTVWFIEESGQKFDRKA